jgi:hypothetical protein
MASNKKRVEVDIVTEATGNGAQKTAAEIEKATQTAQKAAEKQARAAEKAAERTAAAAQKAADKQVQASQKATAAAEKAAEKRKAAAENALKSEIDAAVGNIPVVGQAYSALSNPIAATGLAVAGLGAIFAQKANESIRLADQLQDLAGQYDVFATSIQRIGNVASDEGSSFEGVAAALNILTKSSQDAIEKGGEAAVAYEKLGITVDELKGKNAEEIFMLVADGVASATDRQKAYNAVLDVGGRSAGQLFATLSKGSEQIRAIGEAKGIFDEDDLAQLAEANDELSKLNNTLTIFAGKIVASGITLTESVGDIGVLETALTAAQGAVYNFSGQTVDLTSTLATLRGALGEVHNAFFGTIEGAEEAAPAIDKVGSAANSLDPTPAKNLAAAIDPIKVAADAAAAAVKELVGASSQLETAQARLAKAQSDAARTNVDLLKAQGEITEEQAADLKRQIDEQDRMNAVLREQASIRTQIIDAQHALAQAQLTGNAEAMASIEEQIATLYKLSETLEQVSMTEGMKRDAEYQKQIAEQREKTEQEITREKKEQLVATQGTVAAEQAITAAQNGRASAPLQKSPLGPSSLDNPIDLLNPTKPRDLTDELTPRNQPTPTPAPAPGDPAQGPENQPAGQATASLEKALEALRAELAALTVTNEKLATEIPASIATMGKPLTALPGVVDGITTAIVGMFDSISKKLTALEQRVNNLRA